MQQTRFYSYLAIANKSPYLCIFFSLEKENQKVFLLQHCLKDLQQHNLIYYPSLHYANISYCVRPTICYTVSLWGLNIIHHTYPAPALGLCTVQGSTVGARGLGCCCFPFRHSSINTWPAWSSQHVAKDWGGTFFMSFSYNILLM